MSIRIENTAVYAPVRRSRKGLLDLVIAVYATWRQRKVLSELEPHLLEDIGVSQTMAVNEASRPIWDIPAHWMR